MAFSHNGSSWHKLRPQDNPSPKNGGPIGEIEIKVTASSGSPRTFYYKPESGESENAIIDFTRRLLGTVPPLSLYRAERLEVVFPDKVVRILSASVAQTIWR